MTSTDTRTSTHAVTTAETGSVEVTLTERGQGRPVLILHGGGGPQTVTGFADLLADTRNARVITPTHPGFGGTTRPDSLDSVGGLAALYAGLLAELDLADVTVIGNSIGGWIAAEMALLGSGRVSSFIIVDGVGIEVPGHPVADFFSLTMDQVAQLSYFDPDKFRIDPAALPPAAQAAMAGNRATLAVYAGTTMGDASLAGRLGGVTTPTLVLWGEADQIADADFGRAFAAAIPGAEFRLLTGTGHLPQLETPDQLLQVAWDFADTHAASQQRPRAAVED
jgi:pimeloyl-ACP methyl ester carboxylesterase